MRAEDLPDVTIMVIGLWHMGYTDLDRVASLLRVRNKTPLRALYRKLRTSCDPLVRRCVDVGLPPGVCRPFPFARTKVLCHLCGKMVATVPCLACSMKAPYVRLSPYQPFDRAEPPLPERKTMARPGSLKRIATYRERFAKGQAIFHPHDAKLGQSRFKEERRESRQGCRPYQTV